MPPPKNAFTRADREAGGFGALTGFFAVVQEHEQEQQRNRRNKQRNAYNDEVRAATNATTVPLLQDKHVRSKTAHARKRKGEDAIAIKNKKAKVAEADKKRAAAAAP